MNERIKSLIERAEYQAQKQSGSDWQVHVEPSREQIFEKFAQLIVQECMKVAVYKDSGYMHPADVAGYMAAGRSTAAQMIKEHFGVEE